MGGAGRVRRRPAALQGALAAVLPSQSVPDVAAGARASEDQRPGPQPPLPSAAEPPAGPSAAADQTHGAGGRAHAAAAVTTRRPLTWG